MHYKDAFDVQVDLLVNLKESKGVFQAICKAEVNLAAVHDG